MIVKVFLIIALTFLIYYVMGVITLGFIAKFGKPDDWWGSDIAIEQDASLVTWMWPIVLPFAFFIIFVVPSYKGLNKFWIKFFGIK